MTDRTPVDSTEQTTIFDYWMAIYRRRGMILLLTAVAVVTSLLISAQIPRTYRAMASFYVLRSVQGQSEAAREFAVAIPLVEMGTVHAFAEILNGRDAKTRILEDFPDVSLEDLGARPIVTAVTTGMLNVTVDHTDPQVAADLANAFVSYFRKIVWAPALNESIEKQTRIEAELAEVTLQIEEARTDRRNLTGDPSTAKAATELDALQNNKFNLERQIRETELRRDSARQEIDSLQLTALRDRRTVLQAEVEAAEIRLSGLRSMQADLNTQIRRATDLAADIEVQDTELATLRQRKERLQAILDGLNLGSLQERNLELVTQTAVPSNRVIAPKPLQNALIAIIISLTIGCLIAISMELRDLARRSTDQTRRAYERWASRFLLTSKDIGGDSAPSPTASPGV